MSYAVCACMSSCQTIFSIVSQMKKFTNSASRVWRLCWHISVVYLHVGGHGPRARSWIRPILGFWGSKVNKKWEISCHRCRWTDVQNLMPPALSAEKSVTVQIQIHEQNYKQTVTDISTPFLSACVDNSAWQLAVVESEAEKPKQWSDMARVEHRPIWWQKLGPILDCQF